MIKRMATRSEEKWKSQTHFGARYKILSFRPTLTFPSFGSTNTGTAPSGGLQFAFGALPKSSTDGEKGDGQQSSEILTLNLAE